MTALDEILDTFFEMFALSMWNHPQENKNRNEILVEIIKDLLVILI